MSNCKTKFFNRISVCHLDVENINIRSGFKYKCGVMLIFEKMIKKMIKKHTHGQIPHKSEKVSKLESQINQLEHEMNVREANLNAKIDYLFAQLGTVGEINEINERIQKIEDTLIKHETMMNSTNENVDDLRQGHDFVSKVVNCTLGIQIH